MVHRSTLAVASLLLLVLTSVSFAQNTDTDWNDYTGLELQLKLTLKPENRLNLGYGLTAYPKLIGFKAVSAGFEQYFGMVCLQKGPVFLSVGNVGNWRGYDPFFFGLSTELPFGSEFEFGSRFMLICELYQIRLPIGGSDFVDYYNWTSLEYNFDLNGQPAWFGPHAETFTEDGEATTKYGFHLGYINWESDFFFYDRGWNWRIYYSFYI